MRVDVMVRGSYTPAPLFVVNALPRRLRLISNRLSRMKGGVK